MPSQDARDTALSAALAMILTRQQSLFHFHVFRQDFKNEISCPCTPTVFASPLQRREADSLEPVAKWLAWVNVLIHSEEITGIVLLFDRDQPFVIAAVGFLHAF